MGDPGLIGENKDAVKEFWRTHGLHALSGSAYEERRRREMHTNNWMAIVRACVELGELDRSRRALDVGCGWGRIIVGIKIMLPNLRIDGIDLVHELVQHARDVIPAETGSLDTNLSVGDAQLLPLSPATFDAAISARVLQYVPDPAAAVKEIARVVKPGGKVVVLLPNKLNPIRRRRYWAKLYEHREMTRWLEEAGLHEIDKRSICFSPVRFRSEQHSALLLPENALQRMPIIRYLGGLAVVSGRKPR